MKSRIIVLIAAVWITALSTAFATLQWPMTVTNIAELKALHLADVISGETALITSTRPAVYVLGYYTQGDRGGGMFEWDPSQSATPDEGHYIATNGWSSGNGRWVRRLNGEVANVRMWGARGDGSGDDTIAIQNAVNGVIDPWPHEILFPAGLYPLTNTIVFQGRLHIRGEGTINNTIVQMHGEHDVFRTSNADSALTNGIVGDDHGLVFESLEIFMDTNATSNAGLVVCCIGEASMIRNLDISGGGYGIRSWGGGAPGLQINHVKVTNPYVAGVCVEGTLPDGTFATGFDMSLEGLSGDQYRADAVGTASLLRINGGCGACSVYDFKAEGSWGGGLFDYNRSLGYTNFNYWQVGSLTIYGGTWNCGYTNCDFVVLRSVDNGRTASVLIHPVTIFGIGHLIRDEVTGRNIDAALYEPSDTLALNQTMCRLPVQYEAAKNMGSRFIVGGAAVVSFVPTTSNAWYRVIGPWPFSVDGRLIIKEWRAQSAEMSFDVNAYTLASDAAEINVIRTVKSGGTSPPNVTKARAGSYYDPSVGTVPFVDLYVDYLPGTGDPHLDKIQVSYPIESIDPSYMIGFDPLIVPSGSLSSIVPAGCTLNLCVTNSLVR